jgi:pyruvate/2-oxoglutarate dehydrogenase complex dihydrolipoamide acyltransferase (E2) component
MPTVAVRIPQIGEGLQEARLVAVLKQPGEAVKRDEPIYQMETDKAVMDVESPYEGTLVEWLAEVDTILPIGGAVANMNVADGVSEVGGGHGAPVASAESPVAAGASDQAGGSRNAKITPRTRGYANENGV